MAKDKCETCKDPVYPDVNKFDTDKMTNPDNAKQQNFDMAPAVSADKVAPK